MPVRRLNDSWTLPRGSALAGLMKTMLLICPGNMGLCRDDVGSAMAEAFTRLRKARLGAGKRLLGL